jgi:tetratricopeptide (TPR) repeat protein
MTLEEILSVAYLLILKLSIVAASTCSIICGYKLFMAGIHGKSAGNTSAEVDSKDWSFRLKSYGPGLFFALFGMVIIVCLIVSSPPSFEKTDSEEIKDGNSIVQSRSIKMRSGNALFDELVSEAKAAYKMQNLEASTAHYEQALLQLAEPLNDLADLYRLQKRFDDAHALSDLALKLSPGNSNFQKTLNQIKEEGSSQ